MLERGSLWRKWDLHVHTPASYQHSYSLGALAHTGQCDQALWDKFVDELERTDVKVVGVTDYFSVDGYKRLLDYKSRGRLEKISLLPNIELRLSILVEGCRLNYHVIFSEEVDPETIEREFLGTLLLNTDQGESRTLCRDSIEEIGRRLKAAHAKFAEHPDYVVGCMNVFVDFYDIHKVLTDRKSLFSGRYLAVLPEQGWCKLSWTGQPHLMRKMLLVKSHALFTSNPNTRQWALGRRDGYTPESFALEFGSLKPCIHGSDAHSWDRLCRPDYDRFCWIKADPTFEGLKQILYEPEERVYIGPQPPEPPKSIYTISGVAFSNSAINPELEIEAQTIPLHHGLVAIIGGKGSGKTALLDLLANCFLDRCSRSGRDQNSFVQRVEGDKPDLQVEVQFVNGDTFSKKLCENSFFRHTKVTYLPQGRIEELSARSDLLHGTIRQLIFGSERVDESRMEKDLEDCMSHVHDLQAEVQILNRSIQQLRLDADDALIRKLEDQMELAEGIILDSRAQYEQLQAKADGTSAVVKKLRDEESDLRKTHSRWEALRKRVLALKARLAACKSINLEIAQINEQLDPSIHIPTIDLGPVIRAVDKVLTTLDFWIDQTLKKIDDRLAALGTLTALDQQRSELLKEMHRAEAELQTIKERLQELHSIRTVVIPAQEATRHTKYVELMKERLRLARIYGRAIEIFAEDKDAILEEVEFRPRLVFHREQFIGVGEDIIDLRTVRSLPESVEGLAGFLERVIAVASDDDLEQRVNEYIEKATEFYRAARLKSTRTYEDFWNWILGNYFELATDVFLAGTHISKLSIGQKGTVLLKIFLAEGRSPVLIDQPEENLDNRFIYEALVGAFRSAKKKRQVIIATHNANLVVNTDAEQVIVADYTNNRISYRAGAIENPAVRKEITTLLEGGEEAFMRREMKYGISARSA